MSGPHLVEIIGGNIYPQAVTKLLAWPTPSRNYRWEHITPGCDEIMCLGPYLIEIIGGTYDLRL